MELRSPRSVTDNQTSFTYPLGPPSVGTAGPRWNWHHWWPKESMMQATPMLKGATSLRALGHGEMVSLALAYLESEMTAMRMLSPAPPPLVSQEELTERVRRMSESELLAFLMPISALAHSD